MTTHEFCPPVIPGTYSGRVSIYGQPAFDGAWIVALVDGVEWGSAVTQGGRYVVLIPERMPVRPPCFPGGRIVFRCGDLTAAESPEWGSGLQELDLTFAAPKAGAGQATAEPSEAMQAAELESPDHILLFLDSEGDRMVDAAEIGAAVNIDAPLVEGYLDELELEGLVTVARTFGGYSAFITPRGRVRAHDVRGGRIPDGKVAPARRAAAATRDRVDDASQHYFVAHEFTPEKTDDLRRAIDEALAGSGLTPYYADNEVRQGHIFMDKILPKIRATRFGIYDLSNPEKPNVFMELGAAIGMGKPYFIICRQGTKLPSDVLGLDRIEYDSYVDLTGQLKAKVTKPSGGRS